MIGLAWGLWYNSSDFNFPAVIELDDPEGRAVAGSGPLAHYVLDINPDRHEKYIPGSAPKVVAPEFIAEYRPDVIIITNPIYEQEIKKQVCELGVSCEFMIV